MLVFWWCWKNSGATLLLLLWCYVGATLVLLLWSWRYSGITLVHDFIQSSGFATTVRAPLHSGADKSGHTLAASGRTSDAPPKPSFGSPVNYVGQPETVGL